MITVRFAFHNLDEGVRRRDWDPWARGNGLTRKLGRHRGLVLVKPRIEVTYETKRYIRFATPYGDGDLVELTRLVLAFWQRFGGEMEAPTEVRLAIRQAFTAMHPVPGPEMNADGIRMGRA